ncbi:cellulose synthase complex periplasmic endoglucanase BcsZ [Limnobacter sp.]|uniref:cellulose synthase complex periplasmic endoglucanase BcsZ n=1 Tax=Limnobacter sp. TaxID=2003368 RepID=UPI0027BABFB6|nr:cellulose synthase complex periplasmic endoglucanase BcsZ [Limnobacter sp.]
MALWRNRVQRLGQVAVLLAATAACSATPAQAWPAWDGFKSAFVSDDGRVIDRSQEDLRTVSEGQSYALFFALVAQDKKAFDAVLQWTENNLSAGDLGKQLPAWIWGKKGESWGVIDANSASDADLWIAYALLEASRVWCNPDYADKARALGDLILNQESMEVSGLGLSILPGHTGFVLDNGAVKLNPSYLPPFMMARFANAWADDTRWAQVYLASQKLLLDTGRTGQYPDWVLYNNGEMSLPEDEQRGDYDAIRTYLWIAMSSESDPTTAPLLRQLSPLTALLLKRQNMPEWFEPQSGKFSATRGPAGFQAAMAPLLQTMGMPELAKKFHAQSLKTPSKESWLKYGYYNGALSLFAQGYMDKFYRFNSLGELLPRGKEVKSCG